MDRAHSPIDSLLEQAACIVRRKKEATGALEPTESYKRGQIEELISFASSNNLWISLSELNIEFLSKRGENEVYTGDKDDIVTKLNNFEYAGIVHCKDLQGCCVAASYGMIDTMDHMHSDAQFAGSSPVPAHVEMMGFLGIGNNPIVGCTVACAVDVSQASGK